jgi:hypothetical protein
VGDPDLHYPAWLGKLKLYAIAAVLAILLVVLLVVLLV